MHITVTITMNEGDTPFSLTADEAADAVLVALQGDENKDYCQVFVTPIQGKAGTQPTPQVP
jgi:hypothetical protein